MVHLRLSKSRFRMIFINGIQETNAILNADNTIALVHNDDFRQLVSSQEHISTARQIRYQIPRDQYFPNGQ